VNRKSESVGLWGVNRSINRALKRHRGRFQSGKFLDNPRAEDKYERLTGSVMSRITRQAFVLPAILVFLTVSTAALAHGHPGASPANESHCVMCMAAHGATHLIGSPSPVLHFSPIQLGTLVFAEAIRFSYVQQLPLQGRAPPLG